jgi:hypothetical protein
MRVIERRPAGPAAYEDVAGAIRLAYVMERKQKATADYVAHAVGRYRVEADGFGPVTPAALEAFEPVSPEAE